MEDALNLLWMRDHSESESEPDIAQPTALQPQTMIMEPNYFKRKIQQENFEN